ncbi:MAG: ArnT family glycosyltransferase [Anaerolineae bacterium]
MNRSRFAVVDGLIALALAMAVLASRGMAVDSFVSWDEPMWAYRSARFYSALREGRWRDTLITGHPGVTAMWAGALSFWWHVNTAQDLNPAAITEAAAMEGVDVHDAQQVAALGSLVPIARQGVLLLHALLAIALYGLLRQLLSRIQALGASLMLLTDPFLLGLSQLLHLDALVAQFMLAAMLALLVYQRRGRWAWLAGSAVATGLALVTKSYALLLVPCGVVLIAAGYSRRAEALDWPKRAGHLFLWVAVTWLTVLVIWPAAARAPAQALQEVLAMALGYASDPGTATSTFFLGEQTASPGGLFYPVAWLFRATPLATIGVGLGIVTLPLASLWRAHRKGRRMIVVMLLYGLLYAGLVSLSGEKFDRYLLPSMLALDLVAGISLARMLEVLGESIGLAQSGKAWLGGACLTGCVVLQAGILLAPLAPRQYLAYYNPLAGGLSKAMETLPVGWGEGMEEAVSWLEEEGASSSTIAAWGVPGIASTHRGDVVTPTPGHLHRAFYVVIYIADVQNGDPIAEAFAAREPLHVVRVQGQPYVWVYANPWESEVVDRIRENASSGAVVVASDQSTLTEDDLAPWPLHVIHGQEDSPIAQSLAEAARGHDEMWFVRFEGTEEDATALGAVADRISHELASEAILLGETPFAYGTLLHYALPADADFTMVEPDQAIMQDFAGRLTLLASSFEHEIVEYGQAVGVNLLWRAQQPIEDNLSVFLHLLDVDGRRWSQVDELLRDESGLTVSLWGRGTEHLSRHLIELPAGLPPGTYRVQVGLYILPEGSHLMATPTDGGASQAAVPLGVVTVRPSAYPLKADDVAVAKRVRDADGNPFTLGPLELIGYSPAELSGRSGESLSLTVCWHCLEDLEAPYQVEYRLARDGEVETRFVLPLGGSKYPSKLWGRGDVVCQPYELPLDVELTGGVYSLAVRVLDAEGAALQGTGAVSLGTAQISYIERRMTPPETAHPVRYHLGDVAALVGWDLDPEEFARGGSLPLALVWKSLSPTREDYTVFVHLVNEIGQIIGQVDTFPLGGSRPTSGWLPGEYLVDTYEIPVPAEEPVGRVHLLVGMYLAETGDRLPVHDAATGEAVGDAVSLPVTLTIE